MRVRYGGQKWGSDMYGGHIWASDIRDRYGLMKWVPKPGVGLAKKSKFCTIHVLPCTYIVQVYVYVRAIQNK